jgi:uncharacterized membrane protein YphA (DoxX/SURF4 family)
VGRIGAVSPVSLDPALQTTFRVALGFLLLTSAGYKLHDFQRFVAVVGDYRVLPAWVSGSAAVVVLSAEVILGIALLVPATAAAGAAGAALLLGAYSGAIAVNLWRGRVAIDCGCGRPGSERPLSGALLLRNSVLVVTAVAAALPPSTRAMVWMDALTIAAGVVTLSLLYAAVDTGLIAAPRFATREPT